MRRKLRMSPETADLISSLYPILKRKIKAALQIILSDADSGKALKDELKGLWSYRVGKFRVIYRVPKQNDVIEIIAIGPRKTIYEETLNLIVKEQGRKL